MTKPGIIITGATGFLGRRLIESLQGRYRLFALDRRPPPEAQGSEDPAIHRFQVDIADFAALRRVFAQVKAAGGAEFVIHLAAYYDFTGEEHLAYIRTNVVGTRNVLELSAWLALKKFIFTSSLAACPFPESGGVVTEATPPTAAGPYAQSKRFGETLVERYQDRVPACIARLAAIFSDRSDYALLDHFLRTWCSNRWDARLLGGAGQSAVPYLHVQDLCSFYRRVIEQSDRLAPGEVLQASPDGCTTHLELYREVTRCWYGSARSPLCIPKPLAALGLAWRERLGRLTGRMPFERAWMSDYIDRQLNIDASQTRRRLEWAPTEALHILKRIPVILANRPTYPV